LAQKNFAQTLIIISLTGLAVLWIPVFAAYYGLVEADCLAADLSIENADLEIGLLGDKNFLPVVVSAFCRFQGAILYYSENGFGGRLFFFGSAPLHRRC